MTHLRQAMLDELQRRNYATTTVQYYIHAVERCRSDTPMSSSPCRTPSPGWPGRTNEWSTTCSFRRVRQCQPSHRALARRVTPDRVLPLPRTNVVSRTFASWNQVSEWLKKPDRFRQPD